MFFFCGKKVQNQELSGVHLTNSGKNQEQLKIRKNQESLDRLNCIPRHQSFTEYHSHIILKDLFNFLLWEDL